MLPNRHLWSLALLAALATSGAHAQDSARVYFRADVGGSLATDASVRDKTPDPTGATSFANLCNGGAPNVCGLELDDVGSSILVSVGVGYRVNENVRLDLTGSYRPGFELEDSITTAAGSQDSHRADIDVATVMLSGYYDFTVSGGKFRPYIGGGVGWARNKIGNTTVTNPLGGPLTRTHGGDTDHGLAWQVGAGVSVPLKGAMVLDVGYKYLDAGEVDSGVTTVSGNAGGAFGPIPFNGTKGDLAFHEFTVGLRF